MKIKHRALNFVITEHKKTIIFMILCIGIAILKRKVNKICQTIKNNIINN